MATFSINEGQLVEAQKKKDIFAVLSDLPDNTKKLISPRDVRDAFFTTWASTPLKVTTPNLSTTEYIGIDTSNPKDRDLKQVIYLGKRAYGNQDIMSDGLLSTNNSDIFFYNTKPDSSNQDSTKLTILAGTYTNLWYTAPYIGASASSTKIDMNLVNPSPLGGAINIVSAVGRVAINGVVFPTLAETSASASNGKILRYYGTYPNGYLEWVEPSITITSVGSESFPTNIYGSPVNVNGYPLEFVDDDLVPVAVGGIPQGFSFSLDSFSNSVTNQYSEWPLVEVIRKIIYPYIPPVLSLSVQNIQTGNTYAEVGVTSSIFVKADLTLYARDENEYISDFVISGTTYSVSSPTRNTYGFSFSGEPGSTFSVAATVSIFSNTHLGASDYNFAISNTWINGFGGVTASTGTYPTPYFLNSVTSSITFVAPMLSQFGYLTHSTFLNTVNSLYTSSTSSRFIEIHPGDSNSITKNVSGEGYFYFGYPSIYNTLYGTLSMIKDPNGYIIHDIKSLTYSAFTYSYNVASSGTTYTNYTIFRTKYPCAYVGDGTFEFTF
jgi:hypothetical protein